MAFNTYIDADGNTQYFDTIKGDGSEPDPAIPTMGLKDSAGNEALGTTTETAPASDTAASGLNGRLQRIAQRLTTIIGLLPTSPGQKTMANSLAVTIASDQNLVATAANQVAQSTLFGAVNETAPASDTASSGLNGRLQRVAQHLTSILGIIPTSRGQKTAANSFAVVLPSDQVISANNNLINIKVSGATMGAIDTIYSNEQIIGGLLTLADVSGSKSAKLVSITFVSNDGLLVGNLGLLKVVFFDDNPGSTTLTDHAALNINTADAEKVGMVLSTSGYTTHTLGAAMLTAPNLNTVLLTSSGTLYAVIVAAGDVQFPTDDSFSAVFGFEPAD